MNIEIQLTNSPTPDTSVEETATALAAAQQTIDAQGTENARGTSQFLATQNVLDTESAQRTADSLLTATENARYQRTVEAKQRKETATAKVVQQATANAQSFFVKIQELYDNGIVNSLEGEYFRLENYMSFMPRINYFSYDPTEYSAENFAIAADMYWISASENANWFSSGCGLVYGLNGDDTWVVTWLALDGYVRSMGETNGVRKGFAFQRWGTPDIPEGNAHMMLIVWDKRVTIFVNGEETFGFYHATYQPGLIAMTVFSGTNQGFGTLCEMKNIELWIFD